MMQAAPAVSWLPFLFLVGLTIMTFVLTRRFVPRSVDRHRPGWGPWGATNDVDRPAAPSDAWARASICIAIGAVVPVVAFTFIWLADRGHGMHVEIWSIPLVITLVCVVAAGRLARKLFDSDRPTPHYHGESLNGAKPMVDDDAFDVVSRRG
jgi:hypothetical protein